MYLLQIYARGLFGVHNKTKLKLTLKPLPETFVLTPIRQLLFLVTPISSMSSILQIHSLIRAEQTQKQNWPGTRLHI